MFAKNYFTDGPQDGRVTNGENFNQTLVQLYSKFIHHRIQHQIVDAEVPVSIFTSQ